MNPGFYREVVESSAVAVVVVGADAVVRYHTEAAGRMLAGPGVNLVGTLFPSLFTPETQTQVDACIRRAAVANAHANATVEAVCLGRGSDGRSIEITAVNLLDSPAVEGIVLALVDRSDLRQALELAERQARIDSLTGLPDRRVLEERGRELFSDGQPHRAVVALLDLDSFKGVNDRYGHQAGDRVIRSVADRLTATLGEFGVVARVGGTVFGILLSGLTPSKARGLLEEAGRAIGSPFEGLDIKLTATCGVVSSTAAQHWPGLLSRAESALLEGKLSKRGGVHFYRANDPGWEERRRQERDALVEAKKKAALLESDVVRLEHETRYDRRTGLLNAAAFEADLASHHAEAAERGETYAIVLCDIDFFHRYNERYLYQPANQTLRRVADALKGASRAGDVVYRYGGEEMIVLLPRTSLSDAGRIGERLRCAVADLAIPHENRPDQAKVVTVSAGVAACGPLRGGTPREVIDAANRALVVAKATGRNRVESSGEDWAEPIEAGGVRDK